MKLTTTMYAAGGALVGIAVLTTCANILIAGAADRSVATVMSDSLARLEASQQITAAIYDVKVDVIQVQQWLTDISATRGLDGLDDGLDQAKGFAERLPADITEAKEIATFLGQPELVATLDKIALDFGPYYEAGKQMADAYVTEGPEAGNKMMLAFDTAAQTLAQSVDNMVTEIDAITAEVRDTLTAEQAATNALQHTRFWVDLASHIITALGIIGLLTFAVDKFRRLRTVASVATAIAAGNLEAPRLGQSRWDELSAVFKAIGIFRDQGAELVAHQQRIAQQLLVAADSNGQIDAIGKSQAVIAFDTEGEVLAANKNFLDATGYGLDEIVGRHHSMFVPPAQVKSDEYKAFWDGLRDGVFSQGEYLRIGKGGQEVWLQASYNPILDPTGRVTKVVKYATDITKRKQVINQLSQSLALLAEGNLGARIDTRFEADFEPVREAFNSTVERLNTIISQLRQTSSSLKVATSEILSGANDLSDRTTKQAASIEETSAAMEQLAVTVNDNARRAELASDKTTVVASTAESVGAVMAQSNDAMVQISASSAKISNIISVIDDIAFQTNLLALNASVEAARAGDAGKGFAVVAVEVRRLAQSAASASSDVKKLIDESAAEVGTGSRLVAEASEKLSQMLEGVRECANLVSDIASATHDQSRAISEVSTAVREMDEMTQHNAALVEETNSAIEQTEAQAADLDRIIDVFVVAGHAGASGQTASPQRQFARR